MTIYVVMGVSGCGKTAIGNAAAKALGLPFLEGDDFHPPLNIAKMSSGVALTDQDRGVWSKALIAGLSSTPAPDLILACSALGLTFRKRLRAAFNGDVVFFHLHGDLHILKRRLEGRKGHFFDPALLASQFAALEMPARAIELDIANPISVQVEIITETVEQRIHKRRNRIL